MKEFLVSHALLAELVHKKYTPEEEEATDTRIGNLTR